MVNKTGNYTCLIDRHVEHVKHRVSLVFNMLVVLVMDERLAPRG
jgi:hypothetical protein